MVDKYKVPVSIAFNYLYYIEDQYEEIASIIEDLISIGFNEFIIADIALILYLKEKGMKCVIHLSGECAEINSLAIDFLNKLNISRYVFHRKNTIEDIESCIKNNKIKNLQYEAFILNEKCHYSGAFCSSLHCDEMCHLCTMPYDLAKVNEKANYFPDVDKRLELYYKELEDEELYLENEYKNDSYLLGSTGCGICELKKLKEAGVTHLKVVGRGKYIDDIEKDIIGLKQAINIIENIEDDENYKKVIKNKLFKGKCSKECYY